MLNDEERQIELFNDFVTVWKPSYMETFWFINPWGGNVGYTKWIGTDCDTGYYLMGNCFRTREEAEFALEKQKLITEIKRYIAENDPKELDWKNCYQVKYHLYYDFDYNCLFSASNHSHKIMNTIYFSNKLDWKKMIADIGEDRIKKYLFGVE